jgi:pyrophosphatase PpaX
MIKAVIFDVDGVLLDDIEDFVKAYQETARMLDLKMPSPSDIKKNFGMTRAEMIVELFGKIDDKIRATQDENVIKFKCGMKVMEGADRLLSNLKQRKAIVTSKTLKDVEMQLGDMTKYFEVIIAKEQCDKHKPDPKPIFLACEKLGIKVEEAVYVGDALNDWKASKNAGIRFMGVTMGASTEDEFKKLKANYVNSLEELLEEIQ